MSEIWERLRAWWERFFLDEAFREKLHFLKRVFLFRDLDERALIVLMNDMMEKSYSEGEAIFEQGDMGRACFIVAKGRVELLQKQAGSETSRTFAYVEESEFFGEMVLLDELPRSATARALAPTRLYILYKSHFDALIKSAPHVASIVLRRLARLLSARLRRTQFVALPLEAPAPTADVV